MKCKICGAEIHEEHSFVFNTDFSFCPNKCNQTPKVDLNKELNYCINESEKTKSTACSFCNGLGIIECEDDDSNYYEEECLECNGTGEKMR